MTELSTDPASMTDAGLREHIAGELGRARERSVWLTDAVDDEDLIRQHSPLMSPLVWDFAHIANQEEIWLVRDVGGRQAVRADIDELYDAFKNPRADRPSLPLLSPAQARGYVGQVRDEVLEVVSRAPLNRKVTRAWPDRRNQNRNKAPAAKPMTRPEATPARPKRGIGPSPSPSTPPSPICSAAAPSSVSEGTRMLPVPRTMEARVLSSQTRTAAESANRE